MAAVPSFKIVLLGNSGVGKSCYVSRLQKEGKFIQSFRPTIGVEVRPMLFETTAGPIHFSLWDCAGSEKLGGLRDGYYIGANAGILMFDVTQRSSYKDCRNWYRDLDRVVGPLKTKKVPVVIVANKTEGQNRRVQSKSENFHRLRNISTFDISVKTGYCLWQPLLFLARELMQNPTLELADVAVRPSSPEPSVPDFS